MDEEFQFKPLTEGLGFHKKVVKLDDTPMDASSRAHQTDFTAPSAKTSTHTQPLFRSALKRSSDDLELEFIPNGSSASEKNLVRPLEKIPLGASFKKRPEIPTPDGSDRFFNRVEALNHAESAGFPMASVLSPAVDQENTLKSSREQNLDKSILRAPVTPEFRESPASFIAFFADMLVILGMTCLFSVVLLLVTGIDLNLVIQNIGHDPSTQIGTAVLLFSVLELYMIVSRTLFGMTLGEWAFDMQLGTTEDQRSIWYPLLVAWRTIVIAVTGFIILPIFSLFFGRDVTSKISGLKLYQQV